MSPEKLSIAERAKKYKSEAITNLHQFITEYHLKVSLQQLNKNSKAGVDGVEWYDYGLKFRTGELLSEFKSGRYKAPAIRRVYIPKGKTEKRPIGIPTIEDKVLQQSVRRVLTPIYEEDFKDFSYGYRPKRSPHQAIERLFKEVSFGGMHYIIDADIKNYFGSLDHGELRKFLSRRVKDGVISKVIDKWLKAGVLEGEQLTYPTEGTPQGGVISPLLSNIYLHYVLDEWFEQEIQPRLSGRSFMVRFADDFVMGFENSTDAERVMAVLPKRFGKYKLRLHPDKTKIVNLKSKRGESDRSFDFLGFTHYLSKSRKGKVILKRKTSRKKLTQALSKTQDWIKSNRHMKLKELIYLLNVKLRGHYSYYGVTFNSRCINSYFEQVKRILHKWLNRRGGKRVWNWKRYSKLITGWLPLFKPKIYHSYQIAKPI